MNSLLIKSIMFAVLGTGTIWLAGSRGVPSAGSGIGLTMQLPPAVGPWRGTLEEPSKAETTILPPDTEFAKMSYRNRVEPGQINVSIVLSGKDRTSIHRPEVCLAGQGWNVRNSRIRTVELDNGEQLGVNCLNINREATLASGERKTIEAIYAYWFVSHRRTTPDNLERILDTAAANVVRGENPRWAYVSLLSVVPSSLGMSDEEGEATLAKMDRWIAEAAPGFQQVFEPVDFF